MTNTVEINQLSKSFGDKQVVSDLTFAIGEGSIFGLLGPNGAGKTTLLRMLSCLMTPNSGSFKIMGLVNGQNNPDIRRLIGAVTESPGLYDRLSVWDNLMFFGSCYRMASNTLKERMNHLLQLFELEEQKNQLVGKLSKGMKQKVSIIRAMLHDPPILFLDEATANLDPVSIRKLKDVVLQQSKQGKTIIYCSHTLSEIDELCTEFAIIKNKLITLTTPTLFREKSDFNILLSLGRKHQTALEILQNHKDIVDIVKDKDDFKLKVLSPEATVPLIIKSLAEQDVPIQWVQPMTNTLEAAYFSLLVKEEELA